MHNYTSSITNQIEQTITQNDTEVQLLIQDTKSKQKYTSPITNRTWEIFEYDKMDQQLLKRLHKNIHITINK